MEYIEFAESKPHMIGWYHIRFHHNGGVMASRFDWWWNGLEFASDEGGDWGRPNGSEIHSWCWLEDQKHVRR